MLLQLFVVLLASSLVKSSAININIFTDEQAQEVSPTSCNDYTCDAACKRYGYKGQCRDGECMCIIIKHAKHLTEVRSLSQCDKSTCVATCIQGGSIGGICYQDFCYCYNFKPSKELKSKASLSLVGTCDSQECYQFCFFEFGLPGACVGDRCECKTEALPLRVFTTHPLTIAMKNIQHEKSGKHHKIITVCSKITSLWSSSYDAKTCNDFCNEANYIGGLLI